MNDDISSLSTLTQDVINQGRMMRSIDIAKEVFDRVDQSRYYIPPDPYRYPPTISATTSDRIDPSATRQASIQKPEDIIDKICFDIAETRAYASRVESKSDSRISLIRIDVDALKTLITTLQSTILQQSEAMKILAAEIDELKSGQLEPLEDY